MDKINQGLEGEVAKRISARAQITPELRKMSGIPNTAFNRSIGIGLQPTSGADRSRHPDTHAVKLFEGDKDAAQTWLNENNRALSWQNHVLASETGALEVMRLITRIEHGVYSHPLQADQNALSDVGMARNRARKRQVSAGIAWVLKWSTGASYDAGNTGASERVAVETMIYPHRKLLKHLAVMAFMTCSIWVG